jgi:hypothetical protein
MSIIVEGLRATRKDPVVFVRLSEYEYVITPPVTVPTAAVNTIRSGLR